MRYAGALAVSDKLRACAHTDNVWHAENFLGEYGEIYEATGTLYACGERLCPSCLARRSSKARVAAREALQRAGLLKGETPYFITLTIPKMTARERGLLDSLKLLLLTWRFFTNRRFFDERFRAGIKGGEFTLGDQKRLEEEGREWLADIDGWHPHIHFIGLSRFIVETQSSWIKAEDLRREWTAAYASAYRESFGVEPEINTRDGYLNCHLRFITQKTKRKTRSAIPLESAIIEVAKYITKFDSWLKIPEDQLLEIANIERWPRMFEVTGDCRQQHTKEEKEEARRKRAIRQQEREWQAELERAGKTITTRERLEALEAGAEIKTELRWTYNEESKKFEQVEHEALNDWKLASDVLEALAWGDEPSEEIAARLKARTRYLDTKNLFHAERTRGSPIKSLQKRSKPLREIGREMIVRGEREKWRMGLSAYVEEVQEFRRSQLSCASVCATFRTLAGGVWYGLSVSVKSAPRAGKSKEVAAWLSDVIRGDYEKLEAALMEF